MDRVEMLVRELQECFSATTVALAPFPIVPVQNKPVPEQDKVPVESQGEEKQVK